MRLQWALVTIFFVNFFLLVLEIVAGRLMAPITGVSLYTWTSIIGVILAGVSIGNYIGGRIADKWGNRSILAILLALSGISSWTILETIKVSKALIPVLEVSFVFQIIIVFSTVFLFPSLMLGTISPLVVALTLTETEHYGDVIGKVYAVSALGSIIGTFLTGFVLVGSLGSNLIVLIVSSGLLLLGSIVGMHANDQRIQRSFLLIGVLLLLLFSFLIGTNNVAWLRSSCLQETDYYCINIINDPEKPAAHLLVLDKLVHSYINLEDPTDLGYGYEYVYADTVDELLGDTSKLKALMIGGGGYTFPRYIDATYPESDISVVEIDPGVTKFAFDVLGIHFNSEIQNFNEDARFFLANLTETKKYDFITNDASNYFSMPYHLTTIEFDRLIEEHLTNEGLYLLNIIDGQKGLLLRAQLNSLKQVFPYVYLSPMGQEIGKPKRSTYVVVSSKYPLQLSSKLSEVFVSNDELNLYLSGEDSVTLSDDYAPVDNLIIPMVADSGWN